MSLFEQVLCEQKNNVFYHLSKDGNIDILEARIPKKFHTIYGEDTETPRVSVARNVYNCVKQLNITIDDVEENKADFFVYEVIQPDQIIPTKEQVPDVFKNHEYWILHDVKATLVDKIRVVDQEPRFNYSTGEMTGLDYEIESIDDNEEEIPDDYFI